MLPHQLELLAPARDIAIGMEAINHGADAVYIGGPAFGARRNACNSFADIAKLTAYAHRFDARIFLTLNTIFRDDELEEARKTAWAAYEAGVDALIIQDMGLLQLDLPPLQLHASTQTDIRTPEKAAFLQDVGFSQIVLARELDLQQIAAIRAATKVDETIVEFFIHGALCVAYSGQCYIGEAHTGRSANRGECNQACRLPYQVLDDKGRFIAHDKHVLSMKDNDQSANLRALIDAGVRSFKIEGRYKDMGYVKNITGHYRKLLDEILEERPELAAASSGKTTLAFAPEPAQNFNRESTDYFVRGRLEANDPLHIGAFDTPKHSGTALGWVHKVGNDSFELQVDPSLAGIDGSELTLNNGDGLTYLDLQKNLVGVHLNRVERLTDGHWQVFPRELMAQFKDLRAGTELRRNRDGAFLKQLAKKSSERRMGVWLQARASSNGQEVAVSLLATDENGISVKKCFTVSDSIASDATNNKASIGVSLGKLGDSIYAATAVDVQFDQAWFVPASALNQARRDLIDALDAARAEAFEPLPRKAPVQPPVPYMDDALSYLGNVLNMQAHAFYAKHGVKIIAPAYEAYQELGEVSLMITKHCVRWSMSLCPKQAKGVVGVKGTIKAEPLQLVNGKEKLTLKFDCKPCEMHVVGKMKPGQLQRFKTEVKAAADAGVPMQFFKTRPKAAVSA